VAQFGGDLDVKKTCGWEMSGASDNVRCSKASRMARSMIQECKTKIVSMFEKHAKCNTLESTEVRHYEKRQKQSNEREEALLQPAPVGVMATMRKLRQRCITRN
jgi:hypothetical protein